MARYAEHTSAALGGDYNAHDFDPKRLRSQEMQRCRLGRLEVSAVGLGCATMTPFYDEPDRDAAIDTVRHAREIGVDFLDSSDAYGPAATRNCSPAR